MKTTATRIWSVLEDHPWWTMTLAVFAQTWFTLSNRSLWFSDEVRYANAYQNLVEHGNWMVLALNGQAYPDKPPVYFWFLWLLDTITPADQPSIFFLGAALSGLFFVGASYALARTLGFNRTVSLGGVFILLSTFFLVALFHYSRMDLMFAAFIIVSHACFFKAFKQENQGKWPLWGFLLAAIATLIKGPLGFIFPLLTCAIYLGWKGEFRRFRTRNMLVGFLAMLGVLVLWVLGVILAEGPHFLIDTVLGKHVIQRATKTFHHREPISYYFIALPLAWLPWSLFVFVTPIRKIFSLREWGARWATRRDAGAHTFLWIMATATFVFLSCLSGKVLIYILPIFPPLALLTASAMTRLDAHRNRRFWTFAAGMWCVFGAGLLIGGDLLPFDVPVRGLGIAAAVMLAGGGLIYITGKSDYRAGLLTSAIAIIVWLYPVGLLVAPSLDEAMSPRRQAEHMGRLIKEGYAPMAFKIYSGIFTYYAGHNFTETGEWDELTPMIESADRIVLSIREKHWEEWKNRPVDLHIVDRQNIAGMEYLVVIRN